MISILLAVALQASSAPSAPPEIRDLPSKCVCESVDKTSEAEIVAFRGVVSGAEMRVDETGQNPLPRQTTLFRLIKFIEGEAETPVRVVHLTNSDDCGVTFDYGRQYTIRAKRVEGVLETDQCLMPEEVDADVEEKNSSDE